MSSGWLLLLSLSPPSLLESPGHTPASSPLSMAAETDDTPFDAPGGEFTEWMDEGDSDEASWTQWRADETGGSGPRQGMPVTSCRSGPRAALPCVLSVELYYRFCRLLC